MESIQWLAFIKRIRFTGLNLTDADKLQANCDGYEVIINARECLSASGCYDIY